MTYYDILGVPYHATQEQIKKAYRDQIRFFHPDVFDGSPSVAEIKTKQLNEAYGVLGNPESRAMYDRILRMHEQAERNRQPASAQQAKKPDPPKQQNNPNIHYNVQDQAKVVKQIERTEKIKKAVYCIAAAAILVFIIYVRSINVDTGQNADKSTTMESSVSAQPEKTEVSYTPPKQEPAATTVPEQKPQEQKEKLTPKTLPKSGDILYGRASFAQSEISVTADSTYNYVVTLKNAKDEKCVSFFVRAGDTVTIGVPAESLYVYFASGKDWYGYGKGKMFGEHTSYSKDDRLLDFYNYTWSYTLYPVYNGNFSETPSNEDEFF